MFHLHSSAVTAQLDSHVHVPFKFDKYKRSFARKRMDALCYSTCSSALQS